MVPRLGTGLAWGHLAIQKCIETKQRIFNVSQIGWSTLLRRQAHCRHLLRGVAPGLSTSGARMHTGETESSDFA